MSESWSKARKKPITVRYREPIVNYDGVVPNAVFWRAMKHKYGSLPTSGTYTPRLECELVHTHEGDIFAIPELDYVIEGVKGELYPIKKEIFDMSYDVMKDE